MSLELKEQVWIFQANPERYDILKSLADPEIKLQGWTVNSQFKDKIHSGDLALIWKSGKDAGIYAIAKVVSDPQIMRDSPEDAKYWFKEEDKGKKRLRVAIEIIKDIRNKPIFRRELKAIPDLKDLSILGKFVQRTNFYVKHNEWEIIKKLL